MSEIYPFNLANGTAPVATGATRAKPSRRQVETPVPGFPGLRLAIYPSGRETYILRYRDPVTGKKTSVTLREGAR